MFPRYTMEPALIRALSLPPNIYTQYTHVEEIEDLIIGRYVRWVYTDQLKKLYPGGFIVSVDDPVVLCKNRNRFFTIAFNEAIVLQKMSLDERIIRRARELA